MCICIHYECRVDLHYRLGATTFFTFKQYPSCTLRCRDSMVLAFNGVLQCSVKRLLKKFMQYGNLAITKLYELICK